MKISENLVRNDDGRYGVITGPMDQKMENPNPLTYCSYPICVIETGEQEYWHFQSLLWVYLVPVEIERYLTR